MKLKITVHGVPYEVDVEVLDASDEMQVSPGTPLPAVARPAGPVPVPEYRPEAPGSGPANGKGAAGGGGVSSPIAGTVLEVRCRPGQAVTQGQDLLIIEAMKMETTIAAPSPGTVKAVLVAPGDSVRESQTLVEFE